MRTARRPRVAIVALAAALVAGLLTGCLRTQVRDHVVVGPPEAGVTGFGRAIAMDEHRLVVRADRPGGPVVYVYDAAGDGWSHSATITPFFGATPSWGLALGVSGDTIAISDRSRPGTESEEYGAVHIFEHVAGTWTFSQALVGGEPDHSFGGLLELSGDGLVVTWSPSCSSEACQPRKWILYQRYEGRFRPVFVENGGDLDLGGDAGRLAIGAPGRIDMIAGSQDNRLRVIDTNVVLPRFALDERVPVAADDGTITEERYRKVDLAGDVLAFDHCCATVRRLHIRTFDGSTYVEAATFPLDGYARWLTALPGVVLLADVDEGVWHAYAAHEDGWRQTNDVPAPDAVAGQFATEPVAVGDRLAVRGDGVVHVLTLEVVDTAAS